MGEVTQRPASTRAGTTRPLPERKTRRGVVVARMACTNCGQVRWFPERDGLGSPHCGGGVFLYASSRRRTDGR